MKTLKTLSIIALLIAFQIETTLAQPRGMDGRGSGNMPAIGVLKGKILDKNTSELIEYATIALIRQKDSTIATGGISNSQGVFLLDKVPFGRYTVQITIVR
ncbi:peptidase associated/transthyretin-like domain-containing protein [Williamwhitmania taraxaci]|uniref:CarboxypepD_reg-like domain-containing protein n=1 Tax=Williamwhitmania taraxaci TaxID=1640674 RepID=A0A1G6SD79_9BACT|nr:carboxypeptidase-like regulatory domain-containing protein [Williamwhitmania taraxaci]SDD14860.1 CarboxypepD_reg-like domain-containing protein [Williamwhitmania taraxaci]